MIQNSPIGLNFGVGFNPMQNFGPAAQGLMMGLSLGDNFRGSAGLFDQNMGLGGLGNGFGNPMMGMGGLNQMGGTDMRQMLFLLMAMMAMQQQQGMGGPMGGGQFPQFGQQFPQFGNQFGNQFGPGAGFQQNPLMAGLQAGLQAGQGNQMQMNPAFAFGLGAGLGQSLGQQMAQPGFGQNMFGPQMGGPFSQFGQQPFNPQAFAAGAAMGLMNGMNGMNQMGGPGQGGGQSIDLQQGQSFTTPGGATINWQGDTVSVKEPGGGMQQQNVGGAGGAEGRNFGAQNAFAMAGTFSGQGFSGAFAMAGATGAGGPAGACGCHHGGQEMQQSGGPKDWKVWGDPHIKNPNGQQTDFTQPNALFTLNDGTKVLMGADNPNAVVKKVRITLPGGQVNFNGYDPSKTSVMQDQGGVFKPIGNANQFMGGGFNQGGFNQFGI